MLRLSGSGTFQILIGTASYVGLVRILSVFGSAALAGYTIGIRVIIFALLPAFGISNAAATMVGQNLGAGRPDRAERAVWTAALLQHGLPRRASASSSSWRARPIAALFTTDPAVQPFAVGCLRIVSLGFVFYAVRHGADAVVQRRRRHVDADAHQPVRVLAVGDPAGVVAGARRRLRPARRVHRADGRLLDARGGERGAVQAGGVEDEEGLEAIACRAV